MLKKFKLKYLIKTMIVFLPIIWFPLIINWLGQYISLVVIKDNTKTITLLGWILTAIVMIILLYKVYKEISNNDINNLKIENKTLEVNNTILDNIINGIDEISIEKCTKFIDFMYDDTPITKDKFIESIKPEENLKVILERIANAFYIFIKDVRINERNIVVTLAYKLDDTWKWIGKIEGQDLLSPEELVNCSNTTFYNVINGKANFIFFPNKTEANKKSQYEFDKKDEDNSNIGSIICKKIQCGNKYKGKCFDAVLSISTYGKQMIKTDENTNLNDMRETIKNIIAPFEQHIIEELAILYIKNTLKKHESDEVEEYILF